MAVLEPPAGLIEAASRYDTTAVRAMADWFREQNRPADADTMSDEETAQCLDVMAHEIEVRLIQARQVRTVLPQIPPQMPRRFSHRDLREFFNQEGLPILILSSRNEPWLLVPTDGEQEDVTRGRLTKLL